MPKQDIKETQCSIADLLHMHACIDTHKKSHRIGEHWKQVEFGIKSIYAIDIEIEIQEEAEALLENSLLILA